MNYKLLKKLKDAGFPMKLMSPNDMYLWKEKGGGGRIYKQPTLSELIEACGDGFNGLIRNAYCIKTDKTWEWGAGTLTGEDFSAHIETCSPIGFGKTIEESVANLWLELNK